MQRNPQNYGTIETRFTDHRNHPLPEPSITRHGDGHGGQITTRHIFSCSEPPRKRVIPRPVLHMDGGWPQYHREVVLRNHATILEKWEKEVADEERDYPERLRLWEASEHSRSHSHRRANELRSAQRYQHLIESLAREEMRKEKERHDVAAMVIRLKEQELQRIESELLMEIKKEQERVELELLAEIKKEEELI